MNTQVKTEINHYISSNIATIHKDMTMSLSSLKFNDLIKQNNPYYPKINNLTTAHAYVKSLVDDYLLLSEEKNFNGFLTQIVIFIASKLYNGKESAHEDIDLEFTKDGTEFLIHIEPAPNLITTSVIKKTIDSFRKAEGLKRLVSSNVPIRAVYGSFYGVDDQPDKGDYIRLCGKRFWEFISGDPNFYIEIITYLNDWSAMNDSEFFAEYSRLLNVFEAEFLKDFCPDGYINWAKLVELNSGSNDL